MGDTSLLRSANSRADTPFPQQSGAESGAFDAENGIEEPRLAAVVEAWPTLPESIKAAILAMVPAPGE